MHYAFGYALAPAAGPSGPWPGTIPSQKNLSKSPQAWQAQQASMTAHQPCETGSHSLAMHAARVTRSQARANAAGQGARAVTATARSAPVPAPVVIRLAPFPLGVFLLLLLLTLPDQHV